MADKTNAVNRREFLARLSATAIGLAVPGCLRGKASDMMIGGGRDGSYFFIQMADPQLFWGPLTTWQKAIDQANRLKPAFVVVCGDLINRTGNQEEIPAYLDTAKKLDKNIPLYNVAGNHDLGPTPDRESIERYEKYFGKIWYSFTYRNSLGIVIDSTIIKDSEKVKHLAAEQMLWLSETLAEADKRKFQHKFIFTHFPLCLQSIDEPEEYFNLPLERRAELLELFHKYQVTAVFSGHYHRNAYVKDKNLELITTSSSGIALGKDPLGFRIVEVYPDHIKQAYYGLEGLPEKVTLQG